jgi:hypothetical protein
VGKRLRGKDAGKKTREGIENTKGRGTVYAQIRCQSLKKTVLEKGNKFYSGFLQGGHIHTDTLHNRHIFSSR